MNIFRVEQLEFNFVDWNQFSPIFHNNKGYAIQRKADFQKLSSDVRLE